MQIMLDRTPIIVHTITEIRLGGFNHAQAKDI